MASLHPSLRALRYEAGILALRLLRRLARPLPRAVLLRLGACYGDWAFQLLPGERQRARAHVALAFPEQPPPVRERWARGCFRTLGMTALEALVMDRLAPSALRALCDDTHHFDRVRDLLAAGERVVFIPTHIGNWEYLGALAPACGIPAHPLARRMKHPKLDRFLRETRASHDVRMAYTDQSPRHLLKLIRAGKPVAILADQDTPRYDGVFVDVFGRPAYTPSAPAHLARMCDAWLCVFALAHEGKRLRLVAGQFFQPERTADRHADIQAATQRWSDQVSAIIRRYPDQWVWMHRRWRTTPERLERMRARRAD